MKLIDESKYSEFNNAYSALSKKLIKNSLHGNQQQQQPALLLTNNEIKRHIKHNSIQIGSRKNSIHDRLFKSNIGNVSGFVSKEVEVKTNMEKQELKFHPKTNASILGGKRRSIQDFLQDMKRFSDRHAQKVLSHMQKQRQIEDESVMQFNKPDRSKSPDYGKLNDLYSKGVHKQLMRSQSPNKSDVSKSQTPHINQISQNMARNGDVSEILYSDALRRQQKIKHNRSMTSTTSPSSTKISQNKTTNTYVVSKIAKELEKSIDQNSI